MKKKKHDAEDEIFFLQKNLAKMVRSSFTYNKFFVHIYFLTHNKVVFKDYGYALITYVLPVCIMHYIRFVPVHLYNIYLDLFRISMTSS